MKIIKFILEDEATASPLEQPEETAAATLLPPPLDQEDQEPDPEVYPLLGLTYKPSTRRIFMAHHADQIERRRNLGRGPTQQRPNQQSSGQPPSRGGNSSPSANSPSSLAPPNIPAPAASPSLTGATMQTNDQAYQANFAHQGPKKNPPFFFRENYCGFIVKGNFMTLGAKPHMLEEGEWIAHQGKYCRFTIYKMLKRLIIHSG